MNILFSLIFVFCSFFAIGDEGATGGVAVATAAAPSSWWMAVIPFLAPCLVAAAKEGIPKLPKWLLPILCAAFGALIELVGYYMGLATSGTLLAVALGAAGVCVREVGDQLKKQMANIGTTCLAGLACLGLLFSSGCTTVSTGSGTTKKVISTDSADKIAPILSATAASAVVYAHSKDPNATLYVAAISTFLYEFLESTNLNAAELQARLSALPIKEMRTPEAQLLIAPVIALYKAFGDQLSKGGYSTNDGLRTLVRALIDGIKIGLESVDGAKTTELIAPNYDTMQLTFPDADLIYEPVFELNSLEYGSGFSRSACGGNNCRR